MDDVKKDDDIGDVETIVPTKEIKQDVEVPDGGYGWFVLLGCFLIALSTFGANTSFSIYLAHYLEFGLFEGASKLDYAAVGGLAFGTGLVISPILSYCIKTFGIKWCMSFGIVCQFTGLLLAAFSKKLWQIYLTQGLLVGIGIGFLFVPSYGIIPQWFRVKRSLATSLGAAGSGIGGVIYNLSIQKIIKNINLKWAFIIQTITCTTMCVVGVILVRTRDEHIQPNFRSWNNSMLTKTVFILVAGFVIFSMQGYIVLLYNLADFTKTIGYSSDQAAIVSCMISVGATFGRPAVGRLSDRFGPITTNMVIHLIISIFCFAMWIPLRNYASAIAFALIQGALIGSMWIVIGPITARLVGLRNLTTVLNMLWFFCGISTVTAPVIGIKLRGTPPSGALYSPDQYKYPAVYCGFMFLAATLCLWLTRGYLLVRDAIAEKESSNSDDGELHFSVGLVPILRNLFKKSHTRKI